MLTCYFFYCDLPYLWVGGGGGGGGWCVSTIIDIQIGSLFWGKEGNSGGKRKEIQGEITG